MHYEINVHKCRGCSRQTTAIYCCEPCSRADEEKWDIEGEHSEGCNQRHAERQAAKHKGKELKPLDPDRWIDPEDR